MKKLMIVLAAVAFSFGVQASSVDWKLTTGGTAYAGMNVYAFTAADLTGTTALAACQSTTASDWTTFFGKGDAGANTGNGTRLASQGSTDGIAGNDPLTFVIVDGEIAEGSNYYVFNSESIPSANVYEPPATGTRWQPKASDLTLAGSGKFTAGTSDIPEPTSGLLLLVGGAMLALRRKRG